MDRLADAVVGAAAANVACQRRIDVRVRGIFVFGEQRRRRHDLPRLAVAALRHFFGDPRFLQRMAAVGRQSFDGDHFLARNLRDSV